MFGQQAADGDLVSGAGGRLRVARCAGRRQALVVAANAVGVGDGQRGRRGAGEVEALQFGAFERLEAVLDELGKLFRVAEVVAACGLGGDAERDLAVAVFKQPGVHVRASVGDGVAHGDGVGRDDEEFARRVLDLRGRRQGAAFEEFQRRHFGEERDVEGAAAQDFRGAAVGGATGGKDEVLDAEEVALYQQDFFAVFCSGAAQPQRGGKRGGGFAVVVKGDVGAVCGGDGVGDVLPEGVEVVEPQRPVVAVCIGDGVETVKECLPKVGAGNVAAGEDAARIERCAQVVQFAVACGLFFVKVDGGEQRAQVCFIAGGFVRADGDGGGVCDVFLQVVVVEERRDVIADAGWQLRREHPPKVGGGQAGKGGNARQQGGKGGSAGGVRWGHGGSWWRLMGLGAIVRKFCRAGKIGNFVRSALLPGAAAFAPDERDDDGEDDGERADDDAEDDRAVQVAHAVFDVGAAHQP